LPEKFGESKNQIKIWRKVQEYILLYMETQNTRSPYIWGKGTAIRVLLGYFLII